MQALSPVYRVPARQLAEMFRVRQQRIRAIIALKELEEQAAVCSELKEDDLAEAMEGPEGFCPAEEVVGTGERHVKVCETAGLVGWCMHLPHIAAAPTAACRWFTTRQGMWMRLPALVQLSARRRSL